MPPQLRSAARPEGLPGLTGQQEKKVHAANVIYSHCLKIVNCCDDNNVAWCIENPANSYLWYLPGYVEIPG